MNDKDTDQSANVQAGVHFYCFQTARIFVPFLSLGQGPVGFGKISFEPSKLGNLMQSKRTGVLSCTICPP